MQVTVSPSAARGTMTAPPSKSYAHRALICAALSGGVSTVRSVAPSQDLLATMDCLRALGAGIDCRNGIAEVTGLDPKTIPDGAALSCRASGSTLRFLVPVALLSDKSIRFTGVVRLMERPLSVYRDICALQGLPFHLRPRQLDIRGPLVPGRFEIPGDVSSQFVSGLLFALPLLPGSSTIEITPPVESRPYIEMTLAMLSSFGVDAVFSGNSIHVPGGQHYIPQEIMIEGDWSNAAFFLALNVLGDHVSVSGLLPDSLQGDKVCQEFFAALQKGAPSIDLSSCPDLGPVCMALAGALHGAVFTGIRRLRMKESDRCAAMAEELAKFGVMSEISENKMAIHPAAVLRRPVEPLWSHDDHRIAMALAVLATRTGGVIDGAEAVEKSLPDYYTRLQKLGIEVTVS